MKVLLVCFLLISFVLVVSPNPAVFKFKKDLKLDRVDPMTCVKCEAVIQIFHFLNDAIVGGAGEEAARQKLISICNNLGPFKSGCLKLTDPTLWDTIYKALRDSLGTFYQIAALILKCPDLSVVQANCE